MLDKFRKRMREDPEFNDDVNVVLNMAGVGLAVASIALALNKKSNANTQIDNRQPVKFRKSRGKDHWGFGSLGSKPRYWFSADKVGENRYRVEWTIDVGNRESKGFYEASSIKEAEAMAERVLDDYVPVFNIPKADSAPRRWEDIYWDENIRPDCINCGATDRIFILRPGVWKCPDCGCVFDSRHERILWDEWDHAIFDSFRARKEREREKMFASGRPVYFDTGYAERMEYTPEAFDSVYYSQIMDRSDPRDRSRILSFNRGKGRVRFASDLPAEVRNHPYLSVPGGVLYVDGRPVHAEGGIELMDGQREGQVNFWTSAEDDEGGSYAIAFTFGLNEYLSTPKGRLDWQGHISDWDYDPPAGSYNRRPRDRRGKR